MKHLILFLGLCGVYSYAIAQVPKPQKQDAGWWERMEYELTRTVDPKTGELPPDIKQREYEFTSKLPTYHDQVAFKGNRTLGIDWTPIGPTDQPGRTRAFAIDVSDPKNFLAASASGGVWRSIDGGASWVKVTPVNEIQTISSIVQDTRPGKTSTWYYGTSELLSTTNRRLTTNIRTHGYGNGIYRSTDNGTTWSPLPSTQTLGTNEAPVNFQGVWKLVLDPTSEQDIIYAACLGGIMRSTNGGADWTLVLGSQSELCFNSDIVISKNGTLYAALSSIYDGTASPKQGIWRSSNGVDWEQINDASLPSWWRRARLAVAPSAEVLYAFVEWPGAWSNPDATFSSSSRLLRYENDQWTTLALPGTGLYFTLTGYAMALAVHPSDPHLVFLAGTDAYRFTEGVDTFTWIGGYDDESVEGTLHPDVHDLVIDPADPNTLFAATDGGIYSTSNFEDAKPEWVSYYGGLETSQIYDVKIDNKTPGSTFVVCGLQDNSSYVTPDASAAWEIASGGDGMTTGVIDGERFFSTSYQGGYILFFGYEDGLLNYYGYGHPDMSGLQFSFFTRYLIDPVTKNTLYLPEGNELWRYDLLQSIRETEIVDNTYGWVRYDQVGAAIGNANIISSLTASEQTSTLFLGSSDGKLYKIQDADLSGAAENISSPSFPSNAYIAHIEIDPKDDRHIILVFSNYNVESIFRTTDGGASWNAISGNLEQLPEGAGAGPSVRCVRMLHTANGINYFAATSSGLFSTNAIDGANTQWIREGATSIGNLIAESIDVRESDGWVVCATQGGGLYAGSGNGASVEGATGTQGLIVEQNYPNPMNDVSQIRFKLREHSRVTIELFDVRGIKLATLVQAPYAAGEHTYELSASSLGLREGSYFYRFTADGEIITKMLNVIK